MGDQFQSIAAWLIFVLSGIKFIWSQHRLALILLVGLVVKSIVFVCLYRSHGGAANTLPLLFTCSILAGVSISKSLQTFGEKPNNFVSAIVLCITLTCTAWHAPSRRESGQAVDAATFQREFDLDSLAPHTVIGTMWETSGPLLYAKLVTSNRPDITIINAAFSGWQQMTLGLRDRPIIAVKSKSEWYVPDW